VRISYSTEKEPQMKITTEYWAKPIPVRDFDWFAIDSDTFDGPGCPIGSGATEEGAIAELLSRLWGEDS